MESKKGLKAPEQLCITESSKGVFGTVPVFSVCRTELIEVSGTGIDVVPNLPKCPVPVSEVYRTYRSVRYRY